MNKGCFASRVCFDGASPTCRACPVFFECRALVEPNSILGPAERRLIHGRTKSPKTTKRALRRLFSMGVTIAHIHAGVAQNTNPIPPQAPDYLRIGFDMVVGNGVQRDALAARLELNGVSATTARTQANLAMSMLKALNIHPNGEINPT